MSSMTKRNVIIIGAIFLAVLVFVSWGEDDNVDKRNPEMALELLKEGNERFVDGDSIHPNTSAERLAQAGVESQNDHAYATVITCSDSRVPVERIFDAGVMDIFVIRVAGNVVQTDEAGSIEYGLAHVNTPVLVVLGHTQCGAVTAVTNAVQGHGHALERNIPALVAPIAPAVNKAIADHPHMHGDELVSEAIVNNVWQSVRDLFMTSPATRKLVESGKVQVVGAIYDVSTGKVEWLDEDIPAEILKEVQKDPARAMNAMAEEPKKHEEAAPQKAAHAEEHAKEEKAEEAHDAAVAHEAEQAEKKEESVEEKEEAHAAPSAKEEVKEEKAEEHEAAAAPVAEEKKEEAAPVAKEAKEQHEEAVTEEAAPEKAAPAEEVKEEKVVENAPAAPAEDDSIAKLEAIAAKAEAAAAEAAKAAQEAKAAVEAAKADQKAPAATTEM